MCINYYNNISAGVEYLCFTKFKTIVKQKLIATAYYIISDSLENENP